VEGEWGGQNNAACTFSSGQAQIVGLGQLMQSNSKAQKEMNIKDRHLFIKLLIEASFHPNFAPLSIANKRSHISN